MSEMLIDNLDRKLYTLEDLKKIIKSAIIILCV